MAILKPIDDGYVCTVAVSPADILKAIAAFNGMVYVETDAKGSQLRDLSPYDFFMVNRVLAFGPATQTSTNRYSKMRYECLLTIAQPINPDLEVETVNVPGQFDEITAQFLTLDFTNTFRAYFNCCGYTIDTIRFRPIWNSTVAVPAINHSGVEISFNVTL
jgi:hypothetical protein